jgi:hypothetical protein
MQQSALPLLDHLQIRGQRLAFGDPAGGVAPPSRTHRVTAKLAATAVSGTPNSRLIGSMTNRRTANSDASSVPFQSSIQALSL